MEVGGLVLEVQDDTDRLWVDCVADLSLTEWEWFMDHEGVGFGGHVQSLFDLRIKRPCKDLRNVDWERLRERVGKAAKMIEGQSQKMPFEADAFKLHAQALRVVTRERPW